MGHLFEKGRFATVAKATITLKEGEGGRLREEREKKKSDSFYGQN